MYNSLQALLSPPGGWTAGHNPEAQNVNNGNFKGFIFANSLSLYASVTSLLLLLIGQIAQYSLSKAGGPLLEDMDLMNFSVLASMLLLAVSLLSLIIASILGNFVMFATTNVDLAKWLCLTMLPLVFGGMVCVYMYFASDSTKGRRFHITQFLSGRYCIGFRACE